MRQEHLVSYPDVGMRIIRRRLRTWATIWLVVQTGWVSALVPRDCCAVHQPATVKAESSCHESAPATNCHMQSAGGAPCPMHRSQIEPGEHHQSSSNHCSLRGSCDGPMAALFVLLSNHGILTQPATTIPNDGVSSASTRLCESVVSRLESPDPPPPRA